MLFILYLQIYLQVQLLFLAMLLLVLSIIVLNVYIICYIIVLNILQCTGLFYKINYLLFKHFAINKIKITSKWISALSLERWIFCSKIQI